MRLQADRSRLRTRTTEQSARPAWGTGLNMQNIPENAKGMFVAPEGWEFTYYDMSQIEARIVAYLADIPEWKQQFEQARLHPGTYDAHCALASRCSRCPMSKFRSTTEMEMANLPFDMLPNDVATASTTGWHQTSSPPSLDCHLSKLSKPIDFTTWRPQRSPCGGMTLLHSSDGTGNHYLSWTTMAATRAVGRGCPRQHRCVRAAVDQW